MTLPSYNEISLSLPAMASWPPAQHLFDNQQISALRAAEAAGRPLLIRGDPGTGKSQLAQAAAFAARRLFLPFVVDSRTEAADLMWRYDAVARLADAHLASVPQSGVAAGLDAKRYVLPGPLWWAFNHTSAEQQLAQARCQGPQPYLPPEDWEWSPQKGTVVLVDEIDKAEPDVPNGLLEALGNGRFAVPLTGEVVQRPADVPAPLVIFTTNEERELPAAFLRRCLVLTLKLPQGEALKRFLLERGRLHFPALAEAHPQVLEDAAELLLRDRPRAEEAGLYAPGLAEYLDLLRALAGMGGNPAEHLASVSELTYRKQQEV